MAGQAEPVLLQHIAFHTISLERSRFKEHHLLPSARMRSEGTVVGSVCLSVTLHLTSRVFVRLTKDTTYLTGNEGQKV